MRQLSVVIAGLIIAGLPADKQHTFAIQCIDKAWSVRKAEQEAKKYQHEGSAIQAAKNPNITRLETAIAEQVGTEVKLDADPSQQSGWLKIRYFNNETLAGLLEKMGVEYET